MTCLICAKPLAHDGAEEHVIPNALGGRLVTKLATCAACNSRSGHGADAWFVEQLGYLANLLDVVRDRGSHPRRYFEDALTGERHRLDPGQTPIPDPSIKAVRRENEVEIRFKAPTRAEAERIVKRHRGKDGSREVSLVGTPSSPPSNFTLSFRVETEDLRFLRSIARIASYYARHAGVSIEATDPVVRFALGEQAAPPPVYPVRGDVVIVANPDAHPLYHQLFVNKWTPDSPLVVYVALFGVFEFLVEFRPDYAFDQVASGYMLNLVSGLSETRSYRWVLDEPTARDWRAQNRADAARESETIGPLIYYLEENRNRLWRDRAIAVGQQECVKALNRGVDKETALDIMKVEIERVLARYGLTASLKISRLSAL